MKGYIETSASVKKLSAASLFAAVIFLMTFTPFGFIDLGTIKATIIHVPVIIGSILLGPKAGAGLGCMFGLASVISNTMRPQLLSFAFSPFIPVPGTGQGSIWALAICFAPRVLVGMVPWYSDRLISRAFKGSGMPRAVPLFLSGIAGSLTNTLLVMHFIFFIFRDAYAQARGIQADAVYKLVMSIIMMNGVLEALIAGILSAAVCRAVEASRRENGKINA